MSLVEAIRHLGWRLSEVVQEVPGLSYNAAAQGSRRIWARAARERQTKAMMTALQKKVSNV